VGWIVLDTDNPYRKKHAANVNGKRPLCNNVACRYMPAIIVAKEEVTCKMCLRLLGTTVRKQKVQRNIILKER